MKVSTGTFTASTSLVRFTGATPLIYDNNTVTTISFYDLEFASGSGMSALIDADVTVTHKYILSGSGSLYVDSYTDVTLTGDALSTNTSYDCGGSAQLDFWGSGDQTITGATVKGQGAFSSVDVSCGGTVYVVNYAAVGGDVFNVNSPVDYSSGRWLAVPNNSFLSTKQIGGDIDKLEIYPVLYNLRIMSGGLTGDSLFWSGSKSITLISGGPSFSPTHIVITNTSYSSGGSGKILMPSGSITGYSYPGQGGLPNVEISGFPVTIRGTITVDGYWYKYASPGVDATTSGSSLTFTGSSAYINDPYSQFDTIRFSSFSSVTCPASLTANSMFIDTGTFNMSSSTGDLTLKKRFRISDYFYNSFTSPQGRVRFFPATADTFHFSGLNYPGTTAGNLEVRNKIKIDTGLLRVDYWMYWDTAWVYPRRDNSIVFSQGAQMNTVSNNETFNLIEGKCYREGGGFFPVGKNSGRRGVFLAPVSSSTDLISAEYFNTSSNPTYSHFQKVSTINNISDCGYWMLERLSGSSSFNVYLLWSGVNDPSCPVSSMPDMTVAHWNSASSQWEDLGNGGYSGNSASGYVISAISTSTFSPFALASSTPANPLPITLVAFNAVMHGPVVDLTWITATETNNAFFTVERSRDGIDFETVVTVEGAGTTSAEQRYAATDDAPYRGWSYYRLRQTDLDGHFTYSDIVPVNNASALGSVYPNPVRGDHFTFVTGGGLAADALVRVLDMTGKLVASYPVTGDRVEIHSGSLGEGVYSLQVISGNTLETIRFSVVR
jgi:hypothetical protein